MFIERGFTLIEIMVVIIIIAVLATISLYGLNKLQVAGRDNARVQVINELQQALQRYYADKQQFPATAAFNSMICALDNSITNCPPGGNAYLGGKFPRDPQCGRNGTNFSTGGG